MGEGLAEKFEGVNLSTILYWFLTEIQSGQQCLIAVKFSRLLKIIKISFKRKKLCFGLGTAYLILYLAFDFLPKFSFHTPIFNIFYDFIYFIFRVSVPLFLVYFCIDKSKLLFAKNQNLMPQFMIIAAGWYLLAFYQFSRGYFYYFYIASPILFLIFRVRSINFILFLTLICFELFFDAFYDTGGFLAFLLFFMSIFMWFLYDKILRILIKFGSAKSADKSPR